MTFREMMDLIEEYGKVCKEMGASKTYDLELSDKEAQLHALIFGKLYSRWKG